MNEWISSTITSSQVHLLHLRLTAQIIDYIKREKNTKRGDQHMTFNISQELENITKCINTIRGLSNRITETNDLEVAKKLANEILEVSR